jgi:hypothetical protein
MRRFASLLAAGLVVFGSMALSAPTRAATPFTDIADSQFRNDIDWAYNAGITSGCSATKFCPNAPVTRDQMASFLVRMFDLPGSAADSFGDDEGNLHENSINALAASGITGGCAAGRYCPASTVTREQMASFISRAADLASSPTNPFYDDDFRAHEADINRLAAAGIGTGCGSYRFCPAQGVTRGQMVAFLHRVLAPVSPPPEQAPCDRSYSPALCIPSPPPQLDCTDIAHRNFFVRPPDPHVFDGNMNGVGCEA